MKVILEKVFTSDKETKIGMRKSVGLKVKNTTLELTDGTKIDNSDGKWINCMFKPGKYPSLESWSEGMEVDIDIVKTDKGYINFEPKDEILMRVEALEKAVFSSQPVDDTQEIANSIEL